MTEHRTITIEVFRTPQGEPTCSAEAYKQDCRWLAVRGFGMLDVCILSDRALERRGPDGTGYLIPDCKCPLWHGEQP